MIASTKKQAMTTGPSAQGSMAGGGADVLGSALTGAAAGGASGGIPGAAIGALTNLAVSALSKLLGAGPDQSMEDARKAQDAAARNDAIAKRQATTLTQTLGTPTEKPQSAFAAIGQAPKPESDYYRMQALKRMKGTPA